MQQRLSETASQMLSSTADKLVETVPQILLAFVVLLVGAVVAHAARKAVLHLCDFLGLDKLAAKVNVDRALHSIGIDSSISTILGMLVYWLIVLFALLLMTEVLELGAISDAIGSIVAYIPNLIAGILLLVIGLLVGRAFRDVVSNSLARAGVAAGEILGYIVQVVIILFVCLLALKQMRFDVSVITTNISVILGVLLISAGLAIAIAIRPVLQNFFACHELRQHLKIGDEITSGDVHGKVTSFSLTSVVISTKNNTDTILPAETLFAQGYTRSR